MKKLLDRDPTPEMVAVFGTESVVSFWRKMWDAAPALPEAGEVELELRAMERGETGDVPRLRRILAGKAADLIAALTQRAEKAEAERDAYQATADHHYSEAFKLKAENERLREDAKTAKRMKAAMISHVDGRDLLAELKPKHLHFCNIRVRINGEWKEYEGDWLKQLLIARDGGSPYQMEYLDKRVAAIDAARRP